MAESRENISQNAVAGTSSGFDTGTYQVGIADSGGKNKFEFEPLLPTFTPEIFMKCRLRTS